MAATGRARQKTTEQQASRRTGTPHEQQASRRTGTPREQQASRWTEWQTSTVSWQQTPTETWQQTSEPLIVAGSPSRPPIIVTDSRGVQVGEHNLQLNSYKYKYEIDPKSLNLAAVFAEPDVREALQNLAGSPGDKDLQLAADSALKNVGCITTTQDSKEGSSAEPSSSESVGGKRGISSFLFMTSTGIQVGDNLRQDNYFTYIVPSNLDAAHLLVTDQNLRSEIIKNFQRQVSEDKFKIELVDAFRKSLGLASEKVREDLDRGAIVRREEDRPTYVTKLDGATVGYDVKRKINITTAIQMPTTRQLRRETDVGIRPLPQVDQDGQQSDPYQVNSTSTAQRSSTPEGEL